MAVLENHYLWVAVAFILGMLISRGFRQPNSRIPKEVRAEHFTPTPDLVRFRDQQLEIQLGARNIKLSPEQSQDIRRLAANREKLRIVKSLRENCDISMVDAKAIADFLGETE